MVSVCVCVCVCVCVGVGVQGAKGTLPHGHETPASSEGEGHGQAIGR